MKAILADRTVHLDNISNAAELLPKEAAKGGEWKEQGLIDHTLVKNDGCVLLVLKNADEARAKEPGAILPCFPTSQQ